MCTHQNKKYFEHTYIKMEADIVISYFNHNFMFQNSKYLFVADILYSALKKRPGLTRFWCTCHKFMSFALQKLLFGSQRRRSLSLLVLTLIFPALLPCLVRDSLCTALQTKILWINWSLNAIDTIETWVSGNLTALTERLQPAIRWTRGRGGESCVLRLFPWRTLISTYSEPW